MPDEEVPVLTVAGSLVGAATAMLLGHHGVASLSLERHAATAIQVVTRRADTGGCESSQGTPSTARPKSSPPPRPADTPGG